MQLFEPELLERQGKYKRYVMEDRFCAIRAAIGTAVAGDVVVLAGKGHEDYIEYCTVNGELFKAWFDDAVEARNALSTLSKLNSIPSLDRSNLPWVLRDVTAARIKQGISAEEKAKAERDEEEERDEDGEDDDEETDEPVAKVAETAAASKKKDDDSDDDSDSVRTASRYAPKSRRSASIV